MLKYSNTACIGLQWEKYMGVKNELISQCLFQSRIYKKKKKHIFSRHAIVTISECFISKVDFHLYDCKDN